MAVFQTGDRIRIADVLGLNRAQYMPGSLLDSLMTQTERDDAAYGTDCVTRIRGALDAIAVLEVKRADALAGSNVVRQAIVGEMSVEFSEGAATAGVDQQIGALRFDILRWLDPSHLLVSRTSSSVVITSL